MDAHLVTINCKPESQDAFLESIQEHARLSLEVEPGLLLYEVALDREDPSIIYVYNIFVDEATFEAHREAPHNLAWRDKIKNWVGPDFYTHIRCVPVYPPDSEREKSI